jgi:hypothetical protein
VQEAKPNCTEAMHRIRCASVRCGFAFRTLRSPRQHAESLPPADAVDLEIAVDREDGAEPLALGEAHQRGIGEMGVAAR